MLKEKFSRTVCPDCKFKRDPELDFCPKCQGSKESWSSYPEPFAMIDGIKCLITLLVSVSAQIISILYFLLAIAVISIVTVLLGFSADSIIGFIGLPVVATALSIISTAFGIAAAALLLRHYIKPLFRSAKSIRPFKAGAIGYTVMLASSFIYTLTMITINPMMTSQNTNQALLVDEFRSSPLLFFIHVAILGPVFEELIFRVCGFGFLKNLNKPLAYILPTLVFVLMHVNLTSAAPLIELFYIPIYFFIAIILTYLYDKHGFWACLTAHVLNNLVAAITLILTL